MKKLLNLNPEFWEQDRQVYYYPVSGVNMVGGYWTDNRAWGGSFTLMTIPKSGHFAPYDNYYTSIHILNDMVSDGHLSCHKTSGDCSVASRMCTYMEDDDSKGTCQSNGQYKCKAGYIGADCTNELITVEAEKQRSFHRNLTGYGVFYFAFEGIAAGEQWTLDIEYEYPSGSGEDLNLYANKGIDVAPSKFDNDLRLLNIKKSFQFSNAQYHCGDTCTFALESIGYD